MLSYGASLIHVGFRLSIDLFYDGPIIREHPHCDFQPESVGGYRYLLEKAEKMTIFWLYVMGKDRDTNKEVLRQFFF